MHEDHPVVPKRTCVRLELLRSARSRSAWGCRGVSGMRLSAKQDEDILEYRETGVYEFLGFTAWRTGLPLFSPWLALRGALDREVQQPCCDAVTMHGMPVTGGRGFRSLKPLWYKGVPPYVDTPRLLWKF